jgi:O-antigen/teichoic acid export membrane protein
LPSLLDKLTHFFPFLERKFVKDTFSIQLASVLSAFLNISLSVILARSLHGELYGRYAVLFALFNFFCVFLNWGVGPSFVPQFSEAHAARDKKEMERLIIFFWMVSLTIVFLVFSAGLLTSGLLGDYFPLDGAQGKLVNILFYSLVFYPFSLLFLLLIKSMCRMDKLAVISCLQPVFFFCFTLVFLFRFGGIAAPVWGFFAASCASPLISYFIIRDDFKREGVVINPFRLKERLSPASIKPYFHFGFALALEKNIIRLTTIIPTLLLGAISSPEQSILEGLCGSYCTASGVCAIVCPVVRNGIQGSIAGNDDSNSGFLLPGVHYSD